MAKGPVYSIRIRSYGDNAFQYILTVLETDGPSSRAVLTGMCLSSKTVQEVLALLAPLNLTVAHEEVPDSVSASEPPEPGKLF